MKDAPVKDIPRKAEERKPATKKRISLLLISALFCALLTACGAPAQIKPTAAPTPEPTAAPTAVPTSAPLIEDSTYKVLQNGSTGNQVLALQQALAELGYLTSTPDGTYNTTTTQAVIALQKMNSLPMNGIADANLQALIFHGQPKNSSGTKVSIKTLPALSGITIRLHDQGVLVSTVQTRLTQLGYYDGEISGVYDVATQAAVKAFQKVNGLKADGACGTATQEKLMSAAAAPGTLPTMEVTVTATPAPTDLPPLTTPAATVRKGSTGNDARLVQQRLIELATELAAKHPGEEYNLVVCDGNVPEEGAALEAALTRALPNAHRVLHGKIDATLAVHLGPNLLGVGVQFLNSKLPA